MRVDRRRIQKEKAADSKISGYVWTGPKLAHYQAHLAFLALAAPKLAQGSSQD